MPMAHQLQPLQRRARRSWKRWPPSWRRQGIMPFGVLGLGALALGGYGLAGLAQLPPPSTSGERPCQLVERNQPIFSGSCRLSRQNAASGGDYLVQLGGGKLYRFQRRGTLLVLNDASGRWPVLVAERANDVQFRWAGLMLAVSRQRSGRSEAQGGAWLAPSASPRSTGEMKQDLLDHLFSS
jgi:hypothetical protein